MLAASVSVYYSVIWSFLRVIGTEDNLDVENVPEIVSLVSSEMRKWLS
jgi:hypothetical protein